MADDDDDERVRQLRQQQARLSSSSSSRFQSVVDFCCRCCCRRRRMQRRTKTDYDDSDDPLPAPVTSLQLQHLSGYQMVVSVALLVGRRTRTNKRKVVGSMPANVVCFTVDR